MLYKSDQVFKGDRLSGLNEEQLPRRISITREIIERDGRDTSVWVVDIVRMDTQDTTKRDFTCDGCGRVRISRCTFSGRLLLTKMHIDSKQHPWLS